MPNRKQIAVAFRGGEPPLARVLQGITDYARKHGDWNVTFSPETLIMSMQSLQGWPGDGVIAMLRTETEADLARDMGIPVINLSGTLSKSNVPRIIVDYRMIGRLAAEHLLERGFQNVAFYGLQDLWYSLERKAGFVDRLKQEGVECSVLETPGNLDTPQPWRHWIEPLEQWLPTLELPVGILAVHDSRAALIVEACFQLGLHVPHDVAVIGVNNVPFTCELARVPLTSVARNDRRVGYEAASLLDRMIAGERYPNEDILVPADGVVARRSTDTIAVADKEIAALVHYVDEHISESFGVEWLEKLVPFSRRSLEHRFKQLLRCTPHEYINRARVRRAEDLLVAEPKQTLGQVAVACGFGDARRFRIVFEQCIGSSPAEFRRRRLADV